MGFFRNRFRWARPVTDYDKVRRLVGRVRRNNALFAPKLAPGDYLNVGCGNNIAAGFVNVDWQWQPGVDLCCDITRPFAFGEGLLGGIYSEHCLEHLTLAGLRAFLAEARRMLQPGARIRIVVPDLEMYARAYVESLDGGTPVLPNEYFQNRTGVNRPVALINELFYGSDHNYLYDYATLAEVLSQAGFVEIAKCAIHQGADPRLLIDQAGHRSESLYVEARKPR